MKIVLVCDNARALTGMRLAGVEGRFAQPEDAGSIIREIISDPNVGLLLVTERVAEANAPLIYDIRVNRRTPLICEIPVPGHNTGDAVSAYIKTAMGVKL